MIIPAWIVLIFDVLKNMILKLTNIVSRIAPETSVAESVSKQKKLDLKSLGPPGWVLLQ